MAAAAVAAEAAAVAVAAAAEAAVAAKVVNTHETHIRTCRSTLAACTKREGQGWFSRTTQT